MRRLALALALLLSAGPAGAAAQFDPADAAALEPRLGTQVPADGTFTDASGASVRLADYLGDKPLLLAPVDLDCGNICGVTLGMLFDALDAMSLEPGSYAVAVVSIDGRETPADARAARAEYLERFERLDADVVHVLVDRGDSVRRLTEAIGFEYAYDAATDQFAHPSAVAVLTPDGRLARWLFGYPFQPSDLRLALIDAGGGAIGTLAERLWLLCHSYDPKTGTYNAAVDVALKTGGGLTLVVLGGFVALMLRRERRGRGDAP